MAQAETLDSESLRCKDGKQGESEAPARGHFRSRCRTAQFIPDASMGGEQLYLQY